MIAPVESRRRELPEKGSRLIGLQDYLAEEDHLVTEPFAFDGVVNHIFNAKTLADTGCNVMAAICYVALLY